MVRVHTNHCHVCGKKVGLPRVVPANFRPQEVLCFTCPDDSFNRRPHPAAPRTAPAVREPLPVPRLEFEEDLNELMRPMFGDEWAEFGRERRKK